MTKSAIFELLRPALDVTDAPTKLGRSLWLYALLITVASNEGRVIRTSARLASDLSVEENTIQDWLKRLEKHSLIQIQSPPPYLVTRLRFWPSRDQNRSPNPPKTAAKQAKHKYVPVGSSKLASSKAGEVGGSGEGEDLDRAVASELGVSREEIEQWIADYPETIVQRALTRVRNTPESQIRKSKEALFRFLLTRLTNEPE